MKKWIIAVLILFLTLIIFIYFSDDEQNLGDNYYYLPNYVAIDIGYPEGDIIYKSTQKYVFNDIKIHSIVISAINDNNFIIAIQKDTSSNFDTSCLRYFIIIKKSDSVYGPYTKRDYILKREVLNIPKELEIK